MNRRRALALLIDPTLAEPPPAPDTGWRFDFGYHHMSEVASHLGEITRTLNRIDRAKRRPRIVECQHPELHPELVR